MKQQILTQSNFECLLDWLDSNRTRAAERYEAIRNGLIQVFRNKGCLTSEDLADETIDRVANRVEEIKRSYTGDPSRYFYGVGKRVHLEYLKRPHLAELPALLVAPQPEDIEHRYQCLEQCMNKLTAHNRALVLQYYSDRKQAKIDARRAIRNIFKLKPSALRVRVFRIRETLERCVRECIETKEAVTDHSFLQ
jgi:DNA-directed RNA polymerase specialized sigma24 family protein